MSAEGDGQRPHRRHPEGGVDAGPVRRTHGHSRLQRSVEAEGNQQLKKYNSCAFVYYKDDQKPMTLLPLPGSGTVLPIVPR